ncbi:MAG: hypothetical protein Q8R02_17675 [Hyphomonadaceae bacterium]|nr:hypothetical protein [Hyphomonadaceae bacterium]
MTYASSLSLPTTASRLSSTLLVGAVALFCFQAPADSQVAGAPRGEVSRADVSHVVPPVSDAVEIVVKFKDDARVKDVIDSFWKDPQAAKAKFEIFKQNRPEMAVASLVRVTYSNELVLAYPFQTGTNAQRLIDAKDIAARLATVADIAYAEPDLAFQTQH